MNDEHEDEREGEMSSNTPPEEDRGEQTHMNEPAGIPPDQPAPAKAAPTRAGADAEKDEAVDPADEPVSKSPMMQEGQPAAPEQGMAPSTPTAVMPVEEPDLWAGLDDYRHRFDEIQADFIEEPQAAVKKAGELVDEVVERVVKALHDRVNSIHSGLGDGSDDTERLRLAIRGYKHLIDAFGASHETHESHAA